MEFKTVNPSTGRLISKYIEHTSNEVENLINRSVDSYQTWKLTDFSIRKKLLHKVADLLLEKKEEAAGLAALEMGKPISQGIAEVEKSAWVCRHYAESSEHLLSSKRIETEHSKSYVAFNSVGVIYAIMPWNFPFWQVFRFVAPNLMAGNTILLKHAPNVPECSIYIERLFAKSGFPEGVFQDLLVSPKSVPAISKQIISNPNLAGVTLTGSAEAGASVASLAGRYLKKSVLELGGSDPYLILADADLELAAESCAISRMNNTGQTCIAAKRFIVDEKVKDDFLSLFIDCCKKFVPGDPMAGETNMGPLARNDLQLTVHSQVKQSLKEGGKLVLGGELPITKGFYYPPTIITDVKPDSKSFQEEIFGPVASVISFNTVNEAVELANATGFGLGAAIFTSDIEKGESIARDRLEAGSCFVNQYVKSDPRLPFGGIKNSGYGRELSEFGIREFTNIKTVVVD